MEFVESYKDFENQENHYTNMLELRVGGHIYTFGRWLPKAEQELIVNDLYHFFSQNNIVINK